MGKELSKACDVACRASVLDSLNQHPPSEENQASPILQAAELNRAIKMREEEGLSRKATNFQQASDDLCLQGVEHHFQVHQTHTTSVPRQNKRQSGRKRSRGT